MGAGTDQLWPPSTGSRGSDGRRKVGLYDMGFMQVPEVPRERGQTAKVGAGGLILPL